MKHGLRHTPEYDVWAQMIQRCLNPNNKKYPRYGGRGIKICTRWLKFKNFYADMGQRPASNLTLERIDGDGDYCPENCKWDTQAAQANNKKGTNSKYYGVRDRNNGFEARIMVNGKRPSLGRFPTPEEAARAYDEISFKLHGEFAALNFPCKVRS